jgi:hypothetical protein
VELYLYPPNIPNGVNKGKLYHTTSVHRRPADNNGLNYAYVWKNVVTACSPFRLDKRVCRRSQLLDRLRQSPISQCNWTSLKIGDLTATVSVRAAVAPSPNGRRGGLPVLSGNLPKSKCNTD